MCIICELKQVLNSHPKAPLFFHAKNEENFTKFLRSLHQFTLIHAVHDSEIRDSLVDAFMDSESFVNPYEQTFEGLLSQLGGVVYTFSVDPNQPRTGRLPFVMTIQDLNDTDNLLDKYEEMSDLDMKIAAEMFGMHTDEVEFDLGYEGAGMFTKNFDTTPDIQDRAFVCNKMVQQAVRHVTNCHDCGVLTLTELVHVFDQLNVVLINIYDNQGQTFYEVQPCVPTGSAVISSHLTAL